MKRVDRLRLVIKIGIDRRQSSDVERRQDAIWVSRSGFNRAILPEAQFFSTHGLIKTRKNGALALPGANTQNFLRLAQSCGDQFGHRHFAIGNDDALTRLCHLHQLGKVGLGFMNFDDMHTTNLANHLSYSQFTRSVHLHSISQNITTRARCIYAAEP